VREVQRYNAALRDGAVRTGAYEFLDTVAALSQEGRCIAINEQGELVYADATHLSKAGSRMVIRHVADRLVHLVEHRQISGWLDLGDYVVFTWTVLFGRVGSSYDLINVFALSPRTFKGRR